MTTAGHQLVPQQRERPHFAPLRLVTFFLLAYGFSWAWVLPWAATHRTVFQGRGWPTHFPSLVGPLLAAVAVTAWTRGGLGVRDLLARMVRWRIGWRWWLICLSPLAALSLILGFMAAAGLSIPPRSDFIRFSGLPSSWGVDFSLAMLPVFFLGLTCGA